MRNYKFYRNIKIARLILVLSSVLLILTLYIEKKSGENILISWFGFIMEAVLIASIADGVAIYALTKKIKIGPFSLKFTGLIQNKRKSLVKGIVIAFKTKFFPKEKLIDELQKIKVIDEIKKIVEGDIIEENSEIIGKFISKIIRKNREKIAEFIITEAGKYAKEINSAKLVEKIYLWSKKNNYSYEAVAEMFNQIYKYIESVEFTRVMVDKMKEAEEKGIKHSLWNTLKYSVAKKTNILNYTELAEEIKKSILIMLNSIKSENDNKEWQNMENEVSNIISHLAENERFTNELEKIKLELLSNMLRPFLLKIIPMIAVWLEDGKIEKNEVEEMLKKYGFDIKIEFETIDIIDLLSSAIKKGLTEIAKHDELVQNNYEKLIKRVIENEYDELLVIIEDVLSKLSDKGIVNKVNEVVGTNIQWLRISGAYVGAIVGFAIFLVMTFPVIFLPILITALIVIISSKKIRERLVIYGE